MEQPNYLQKILNRIKVPVEQEEVTAGSVKTAYLSAGSGPPVVCLHGGGFGAIIWYPVIGALAKHFHVIVPDLVGFGESDKPNVAYDRPYYVSWLRGFFRALKIPKAHVVGLSMGGAISIQFALENPDMVAKLALVDFSGLPPGDSIGSLLSMIFLNFFPSKVAIRNNFRYITTKPEKLDPDLASFTIQGLKQPNGRKFFFRGRGVAATATILDETLRQIQHQTLILWGEADRFYHSFAGEAAAKIIPNARFHLIQNAGHVPFIDQPEVFNNALVQFLRE